MAFEKAASEKDIIKQRQHLTFVIVGGGPTGVELAGAIGSLVAIPCIKILKILIQNHTSYFD